MPLYRWPYIVVQLSALSDTAVSRRTLSLEDTLRCLERTSLSIRSEDCHYTAAWCRSARVQSLTWKVQEFDPASASKLMGL